MTVEKRSIDRFVRHLVTHYHHELDVRAAEIKCNGILPDSEGRSFTIDQLKAKNRQMLSAQQAEIEEKLLYLNEVNMMLCDREYYLTEPERLYCLEYFSDEMNGILSELIGYVQLGKP